MFEVVEKFCFRLASRLNTLVAVLLLAACAPPQDRPSEPAELLAAFSSTGQPGISAASNAWKVSDAWSA